MKEHPPNVFGGCFAMISYGYKKERAFLQRAEALYAKALRQTTMQAQGITAKERLGYLRADYNAGLLTQEEFDNELEEIMAEDDWETVSEVGEKLDRPMSEAEFEADGEDGVRHSFSGRKAKNADLGALLTAQNMQENGVSAKEIFTKTGWFVGADDEWRFEIDDSGMKYRRAGDGKYAQEPEYVEYNTLWEKVYGTGDASAAEIERLRELDAKYGRVAQLFSINLANGNATLEDILVHDELFQNYPELRKVRVRFAELEPGTTGAYLGDTNEIVLSNRVRNAPEETLIHEIQHAIQNIEGFARGSSPKYWESEGSNAQRVAAAERIRNKIETLEDMLQEDSEDADVIRAEVEELKDKLDELSYHLYRNTAGEIEARDAASRRRLTAEQRRGQMPDTGDEDTVFSDGSMQYSISKTRHMSIKDQFREYRANTLPRNQHFYFGKTPEIFASEGMGKDPLVMKQKNYKKSRSEKHNVPNRAMIRLKELLERPIFSFGNNNSTGVVVDEIDADGKPLLIGIAKNVTLDGEKVNEIKSSYGLDNPQEWIKNQIKEGLACRIYDIEKAERCLNSVGYKAERSKNFRIGDIVTLKESVVNRQYSFSPAQQKTAEEQRGKVEWLHENLAKGEIPSARAELDSKATNVLNSAEAKLTSKTPTECFRWVFAYVFV